MGTNTKSAHTYLLVSCVSSWLQNKQFEFNAAHILASLQYIKYMLLFKVPHSPADLDWLILTTKKLKKTTLIHAHVVHKMEKKSLTSAQHTVTHVLTTHLLPFFQSVVSFVLLQKM